MNIAEIEEMKGVTVSDFRRWLQLFIVEEKKGSVPDKEDWKRIKSMVDRIIDHDDFESEKLETINVEKLETITVKFDDKICRGGSDWETSNNELTKVRDDVLKHFGVPSRFIRGCGKTTDYSKFVSSSQKSTNPKAHTSALDALIPDDKLPQGTISRYV